MKNFQNILFVSFGITDESEALKQALSLARNNKAKLMVLVVCPEFPEKMAGYQELYKQSLKDKIEKTIRATQEALQFSNAIESEKIEIESGSAQAIRVIRHVLKGGYDLVIKQAENKESGKGFVSVDMELLHKCPCPVWLCRPIMAHHDRIQVAVAIDPDSIAQEGHDLSLQLLRLSRSLADDCSGELHIISCWDFPYENTLRNSAWISVSEDELQDDIKETKANHLHQLNLLIKESGIGGNVRVEHIRGAPDTIIPEYVDAKHVDILVMGTLARSGIQSFIIGNTAENIVQKLSSSLMALKPNGFISPVKIN